MPRRVGLLRERGPNPQRVCGKRAGRGDVQKFHAGKPRLFAQQEDKAPEIVGRAGKEALAIIGGLEYGVGDTLPNTGDVIRFIGSDGVRLYSPSRNAEWTLPYSGDDI